MRAEWREIETLPIWEAVARGKGRTEGFDTLNQALVRGLLSFFRVFEVMEHFSASLHLLFLVKNVSMWDPPLDPACDGGGSPCG